MTAQSNVPYFSTASLSLNSADISAAGDLDVTDDVTVGGDIAITGDVAVGAAKLTVAGASGNTAIAGTLAVTGASTLTGATTVTGALRTNGGLGVGKTPVVTQTHIADPAGAVTDTDDEARAAIAAILDVLEAFGLTATS